MPTKTWNQVCHYQRITLPSSLETTEVIMTRNTKANGMCRLLIQASIRDVMKLTEFINPSHILASQSIRSLIRHFFQEDILSFHSNEPRLSHPLHLCPGPG